MSNAKIYSRNRRFDINPSATIYREVLLLFTLCMINPWVFCMPIKYDLCTYCAIKSIFQCHKFNRI